MNRTEVIDITILLFDGGLASTAVGPGEIFRLAGVAWNELMGQPVRPRFRVTTASLDGRAVSYEGGFQVQPAASIRDIRRTELILVTSAGVDHDRALATNAALLPWLQRWRQRGAGIASICSGAGLAAAAGILDGKRATTHWALADGLRRRYPAVYWMPQLMVTEDDGVYCSGGVNASFDLSLYLVEKYCGREVTVQCAKALLIETPRTWQSGFAMAPLRTSHQDEAVARAEKWLLEHYRDEAAVTDLAVRAGMSPRNFARRFRAATGEAPLGYLQKLRVEAAKRLFETEYRTVQEVSCAVGYEDPVFFRNLFKRYAGVSPQAYRQRFGKTSRLEALSASA